MLDQTFGQVYTKFKLHFYKQIFSRFEDREATLTTVESFCMEVIMALGEPTIAQFSHMMNLSTPNAAYKINSLVKKGYVERIRSTTDKREYAQWVILFRVVIFTHRITNPIVAQVEPAHIRMTDKGDAIKIKNFTFVEVGYLPDVADRRYFR